MCNQLRGGRMYALSGIVSYSSTTHKKNNKRSKYNNAWNKYLIVWQNNITKEYYEIHAKKCNQVAEACPSSCRHMFVVSHNTQISVTNIKYDKYTTHDKM